ncbi:hypothetical protein Vretimale_16810, partial [Volvox reticuliferus]
LHQHRLSPAPPAAAAATRRLCPSLLRASAPRADTLPGPQLLSEYPSAALHPSFPIEEPPPRLCFLQSLSPPATPPYCPPRTGLRLLRPLEQSLPPAVFSAVRQPQASVPPPAAALPAAAASATAAVFHVPAPAAARSARRVAPSHPPDHSFPT